jgi:enamine deaminase RidA (YjgF/YER057c/UK114 family)
MNMRLIIPFLFFVLSLPTMGQKKPVVTSLENPAFLSPTKGYSHVAKIDMGNAWMLIISGQVPMDKDGNIIGKGNFEAQTDFVYAKLVEIVKHYGGTRDHIVRTGILIVDEQHIPLIRQVRTKYLNMDKPPTSTAMVVSKLFHPDFLVEIEATAVIPK